MKEVMNQGDERRAFETWLARRDDFEPEYLHRRNVPDSSRYDEYVQSNIEIAWLAWQAARALSAAQPVAQEENVKVGGSTVYVTNNHRRESNRWWATVYPGFDDDDKRVSVEECDAIARKIADALNAAPHHPASAEAGKGVERDTDELGEVVRAAIWDSAEVVAPGRLSQPEPQEAAEPESVAVSGEVSDEQIVATARERQKRLAHWDYDDLVSFARAVIALAGEKK